MTDDTAAPDFEPTAKAHEEHYGLRAVECGVPPDAARAIARFIVRGIDPGDFLTAVFKDKLVDSFGKADQENTRLMRNYAHFMYDRCPTACRGIENFKSWQESGGLLGQAIADAAEESDPE